MANAYTKGVAPHLGIEILDNRRRFFLLLVSSFFLSVLLAQTQRHTHTQERGLTFEYECGRVYACLNESVFVRNILT